MSKAWSARTERERRLSRNPLSQSRGRKDAARTSRRRRRKPHPRIRKPSSIRAESRNSNRRDSSNSSTKMDNRLPESMETMRPLRKRLEPPKHPTQDRRHDASAAARRHRWQRPGSHPSALRDGVGNAPIFDIVAAALEAVALGTVYVTITSMIAGWPLRLASRPRWSASWSFSGSVTCSP